VSAPKTSEFERIAGIERLLGRSKAPGSRAIELGIGDDAAVLRLDGRAVWTVDAQVEGVHFRRRWLTLEDVGYRSFQAAASDLAAMGARPLCALSSLALPAAFSDAELSSLVRGQSEAARACRCPVVGGNLSRASELSVTTTLLGQVDAPLLRSAARVEDELWLVGDVGSAALGLHALGHGSRKDKNLAVCIARWRRPSARIAEGRRLAGRARAAIDVSDGLAGDAGHMARASGVRLVLEAELIEAALAPELVAGARRLGLSALDLALYGGEDYALLCAGPAERRPRFARPVGHVERGAGVWLERSKLRKKLTGSFDHFSM
jgi:thiamine-monophosphate kinase